jgi:hypothetical protein
MLAGDSSPFRSRRDIPIIGPDGPAPRWDRRLRGGRSRSLGRPSRVLLGSTASVTAATTARPRRRIACVRILVRSRGERTILTAAATTAIARVRILVRSRGKRPMRTAAATASRSARDWRKQSQADGRSRRRHAEHDAQSLWDHCRPLLRLSSKSYPARPTIASFTVMLRGGGTVVVACGGRHAGNTWITAGREASVAGVPRAISCQHFCSSAASGCFSIRLAKERVTAGDRDFQFEISPFEIRRRRARSDQRSHGRFA